MPQTSLPSSAKTAPCSRPVSARDRAALHPCSPAPRPRAAWTAENGRGLSPVARRPALASARSPVRRGGPRGRAAPRSACRPKPGAPTPSPGWARPSPQGATRGWGHVSQSPHAECPAPRPSPRNGSEPSPGAGTPELLGRLRHAPSRPRDLRDRGDPVFRADRPVPVRRSPWAHCRDRCASGPSRAYRAPRSEGRIGPGSGRRHSTAMSSVSRAIHGGRVRACRSAARQKASVRRSGNGSGRPAKPGSTPAP